MSLKLCETSTIVRDRLYLPILKTGATLSKSFEQTLAASLLRREVLAQQYYFPEPE